MPSDTNDARRAGREARVWWDLPEQVWLRSKAMHEAAHAVVGLALGLRLVRLWITASERELTGGAAEFSGPADAQLFTIWLVAGPLAHARWLREHGYDHPDLRRSVLDVLGQGDEAEIAAIRDRGLVIDRDRAVLDATRMLAHDPLWTAVQRVGDQLYRQLALAPAEVQRLAGPLPTFDVWTSQRPG